MNVIPIIIDDHDAKRQQRRHRRNVPQPKQKTIDDNVIHRAMKVIRMTNRKGQQRDVQQPQQLSVTKRLVKMKKPIQMI